MCLQNMVLHIVWLLAETKRALARTREQIRRMEQAVSSFKFRNFCLGRWP